MAMSKKAKWNVFFFSLIILLIISYLWFNSSVTTSNKAYIEKVNKGYLLTIVRKRKLASHDPISFLKRKTYYDSIKLEVPTFNKVIECSDVAAKQTNFKFIQGNLEINNKSLQIQLFYISEYYKTTNDFPWNGYYELEWRK